MVNCVKNPNYRLKKIPIKLSKALFTELEFFFLICMETQNTFNSQNNLEKEKQSWRTQAPFRLYDKAIGSKQYDINTHKKHIDQRNRIESPCQLIYNKGGKNIQQCKDSSQ